VSGCGDQLSCHARQRTALVTFAKNLLFFAHLHAYTKINSTLIMNGDHYCTAQQMQYACNDGCSHCMASIDQIIV
jgi:hypothetical protein